MSLNGPVVLVRRIVSSASQSPSSQVKMKLTYISLACSLGFHTALAQHNLSWSPPGPDDCMYNSLYPIYYP